MFVKLFKHEWKANAKLFTILSCCTLGAGCLCGIMIRYLSGIENQQLSLLTIPVTLLTAFAFLAIFCFSACVYIVLLVHFYKSHFTDSGYLTFTLPVKTSHILLSSALNILVWSLTCIVVSISSFILAMAFSGNNLLQQFTTIIKTAIDTLLYNVTTEGIITFILYGIATVAYLVFVPLFAITTGSVIAKKHKVLATIGILYGLSFVNSLLDTMLLNIFMYSDTTDVVITQMETYTNAYFICSSLIPLIFVAVAYPLTIHFMKNKLNLP